MAAGSVIHGRRQRWEIVSVGKRISMTQANSVVDGARESPARLDVCARTALALIYICGHAPAGFDRGRVKEIRDSLRSTTWSKRKAWPPLAEGHASTRIVFRLPAADTAGLQAGRGALAEARANETTKTGKTGSQQHQRARLRSRSDCDIIHQSERRFLTGAR